MELVTFMIGVAIGGMIGVFMMCACALSSKSEREVNEEAEDERKEERVFH